ncbi:ABC transporter substrate-binding protein [Haloplanus sp. GCM10025708]|uniref:ABC transporter substrate-binding protein n=1 Tax=Haloplanus sp. GCM10025708 TaxID=3252679 RepID=UPI003615FA27
MSRDDGRALAPGRRDLLRVLGGGTLAGLAGCAGGAGGDGGSELVATLSADVKNYDPTQANDTTSSKAFGLVYETLLTVDFDGTPRPTLATSVERLDELRWRLSIREGVTFHDGSELTAADVKSTFERYEGTPRESLVFLWYDSATIRDDYTLDVTLKEGYAPFRVALSNVPIVPEAAATDELDLSTDPVGTGPYRFAAHEPDSLFRLRKHDDYWFEGDGDVPATPPIDTLTFRIVVGQSEQLAALRGGDVDLINTPPASAAADLRDSEEFTLTSHVAGGTICSSSRSRPNRTRTGRSAGASPVWSPARRSSRRSFTASASPRTPPSPLLEEYASESFQREMRDQYSGYDPDRATELLAAGFDELGLSTPHEARIIVNQNPQRVKFCQLIAAELNATEFFETSVEQFEWNTYTGKVLTGGSNETDAMMALGWSGGWDPDDYVRNLFYSDQRTPACCNAAHYSNPEVDRLLDEGLATYDVDERERIYRDAQERIVADAPVIFVRFARRMEAYRNDRVSGFETYPLDGEEFAGIYAPSAGVYTETK